ncbi:ankyrin [Choiromyces venosus 120613-1]|uniref:Ankyrin n=1 Tax=Choiromyces venosus 120613-1 TaxID=1336337 RepID=A0A3N4JFU5_9PEZI|nr:ankyrin [Choiromyces venosus 120613-1]
MSFLSLPNEIILEICKDARPHALYSLVLTNRRLANLLSLVLLDCLFRPYPRRKAYARKAFYSAAEREDKTIVRLLIDKGVLDILGPGHRRFFYYITEPNCGKAVRTLLDCGVSAESCDSTSWSMIHWAARYGALTAVQEFISREEIAINVLDRDSYTPLYIASRDGRRVLVQAFVNCPRVDVNIANAQLMTPLGVAAGRGDVEMVKILLKHGMIESSLLGIHATAPIFLAAKGARVDVVRLLLEDGRCEVNWRDPAGRTALYVAAEHGNATTVQLLMQDERVDVNIVDNTGATPLYRAIRNARGAVVQLLLSRDDIDLDRVTANGRTIFSLPRSESLEVRRSLWDYVAAKGKTLVGNVNPWWNGHIREEEVE